MLPIDGTARLTGYGTLALRTGGSELKSQLYPATPRRSSTLPPSFSGRYTDVYALAAVCYRMVTGQTPVAAPQRKVRDSIESAHSLEAGVLHGSRRCWPARCGWTPPSGCRPCPS